MGLPIHPMLQTLHSSVHCLNLNTILTYGSLNSAILEGAGLYRIKLNICNVIYITEFSINLKRFLVASDNFNATHNENGWI